VATGFELRSPLLSNELRQLSGRRADLGWLAGSTGLAMPQTRRKALVPNEKQLSAGVRRRAVVVQSRGDRTAIELFVAGVRGWEGGLRRVLGGQLQPLVRA